MSTKDKIQLAVIALAAIILAFIVAALYRGTFRAPTVLRGDDKPPKIEFTWTPLGTTTLREFRGHLIMNDDHGLDFSTYKFRVVEAEKEVGLPIDGLSGKSYESDVSLGLLESNAKLVGKTELHLVISISDDTGQNTEIKKTILLK